MPRSRAGARRTRRAFRSAVGTRLNARRPFFARSSAGIARSTRMLLDVPHKEPVTHPLDALVLELARTNGTLDVTTLAEHLSGVNYFIGRGAKMMERAYRLVAAEVLGGMASAGTLVQHGKWPGPPHRGGPDFTLPAANSATATA